MQRNIRSARLLWAVPVLLLLQTVTAPALAAGTYPELLELFRDWQAFERPALLDGAPDYTAPAMLRRQQAEAVIAARQKIVHGAVSMVEMALRELSEKKVVNLDEERKAAMVSMCLRTMESSPVRCQ